MNCVGCGVRCVSFGDPQELPCGLVPLPFSFYHHCHVLDPTAVGL